MFLDEFLVRDHPARGDCREETEAFLRLEILRSRISEVEFHQIAVVVTVSYAAGEAHVALGNRFEDIVIDIVFRKRLHVIVEQTADPVLVESSVVCQLHFAVGAPGAVDVRCLPERLLVYDPRRNQIAFHVADSFCLVQSRHFQAAQIVPVVGVIGEPAGKMQPLRNKTQVLFQSDVRFHLVFPERVITGVVEQYIRRNAVSVRTVGRQLAV